MFQEVYEQSVKEPITKSLFPEYAGATMLEKDSLRLHLSGEKLRPGAGYSAEDDVEGTIKGEEEPDKECLPNSGCQGSDAIVEAQEVESGRSGLECVDLRSTEVHHTSGISRTSEVSRKNNVQTSTRDEQIDAGSERNVFRGEKLALEDVQIVEEDKKSVDERNLNNEEFARNKENSKEIIDDATNMVCSSVITDTLEKGLERLGMKESSKEIQVRVT